MGFFQVFCVFADCEHTVTGVCIWAQFSSSAEGCAQHHGTLPGPIIQTHSSVRIPVLWPCFGKFPRCRNPAVVTWTSVGLAYRATTSSAVSPIDPVLIGWELGSVSPLLLTHKCESLYPAFLSPWSFSGKLGFANQTDKKQN